VKRVRPTKPVGKIKVFRRRAGTKRVDVSRKQSGTSAVNTRGPGSGKMTTFKANGKKGNGIPGKRKQTLAVQATDPMDKAQK